MKLAEGKEKFIQAWGTLGSSWGINRTMAQVHALLLIVPDSLSAEDIMEELNISRERKEYFSAEKDIWKVATQVVKERRKRELEPVLKILNEISNIEGDKKDKRIKAFTDSISQINNVVSKADKTLETFIKADENWFVSSFMKLMK